MEERLVDFINAESDVASTCYYEGLSGVPGREYSGGVTPPRREVGLSSTGEQAFRSHVKPGWVYVGRFDGVPGVKIGGTGKSPFKRWKQHGSGFEGMFFLASKDWMVSEASIHSKLREFHLKTPGFGEQFDVSVAFAYITALKVLRYGGDGLDSAAILSSCDIR
jgi:hypothetical protein